jgi:hypothetical protein
MRKQVVEADCQIQKSSLLNLAALAETGLTQSGTGAGLLERSPRRVRPERATSRRKKSQKRRKKPAKMQDKTKLSLPMPKRTPPCMSDHMCAHPR